MRRIFWGFCIKQFGIGPLHYISSRSTLALNSRSCNRKRLPDSPSRGVDKIAYRYNFFQIFKYINGDSTFYHQFLFCQIDLLKGWFSRLKCCNSMINLKKFEQQLHDSPQRFPNSASRGVTDSPTCRVFFQTFKCRLPDLPSRRVANHPSRVRESPSRGFVFLLRISPRI